MFQEKETGATFTVAPVPSDYNDITLEFVPRNIVIADVNIVTQDDIGVHDLTSFHRYNMYPICISKRKLLDRLHQQGEHVGQGPPEHHKS